MKKKKITIILILLFIFGINYVKADSGYDSSYGAGSYGGSSYGVDSSSSSFLGINESNWWVYLIFLGISLIGSYIVYLEYKERKKEFKKERRKEREKLEETVNDYLDISSDELRKDIAYKFVEIQVAWMNFDYDTLKKLCSNALYNTYHEELETLKLKGQKNIMSDFQINNVKIKNIGTEGNNTIIDCVLSIILKDYIINEATGEIVKGNDKEMYNSYALTFAKSNSKKIVDICPNCGGKIEQGTTECEHCKAVIVQDSNELVLIEKRKIN